MDFSLTKHIMDGFSEEVELEKLSLGFKLGSFTGKAATKEASAKRRERSKKDYWYFDRTYFLPQLYEGYAKPNKMLKDIVKACHVPGIHLFVGPRKHGKTVEGKKLFIWLLLTGKINIGGVYAETILKSSKLLSTISLIIQQNERIKFDYKFKVLKDNADELQMKMTDGQTKPIRTIASFSEGRSVKGYTEIFTRPQFLLGDDVETLESSFTTASVQLRMDKIGEAYQSLNDGGVFIILANDFRTNSFVHQVRYESENNLLPDNWHVYAYQAWRPHLNPLPEGEDDPPPTPSEEGTKKPPLQKEGALWDDKYPAESEAELKKLLKPKSESDWQANFQQNPVPPEGDYFKLADYDEYISLPKDTRGIIYTDPNLSKKGKGNTTSIVPMVYSPETDMYYVPQVVCKSFSDSNKELDAVFAIRNSIRGISGVGFDGNVTQESTWTQFVKNYCRIKQTPFPHIEYKRYRVNDLAKNLQSVYTERRIKFAPGFSKTVDGERFLAQFFSFSGEKKEGADDGPDAIICAFEFIHERKLVKRVTQPVKVFKDYYQL